MTLVREMPVAAIAALIKEHDTRIWRVLHHYVEEARQKADYSEVKRIGMDETASSRGHQSIMLLSIWMRKGSCLAQKDGISAW